MRISPAGALLTDPGSQRMLSTTPVVASRSTSGLTSQ